MALMRLERRDDAETEFLEFDREGLLLWVREGRCGTPGSRRSQRFSALGKLETELAKQHAQALAAGFAQVDVAALVRERPRGSGPKGRVDEQGVAWPDATLALDDIDCEPIQPLRSLLPKALPEPVPQPRFADYAEWPLQPHLLRQRTQMAAAGTALDGLPEASQARDAVVLDGWSAEEPADLPRWRLLFMHASVIEFRADEHGPIRWATQQALRAGGCTFALERVLELGAGCANLALYTAPLLLRSALALASATEYAAALRLAELHWRRSPVSDCLLAYLFPERVEWTQDVASEFLTSGAADESAPAAGVWQGIPEHDIERCRIWLCHACPPPEAALGLYDFGPRSFPRRRGAFLAQTLLRGPGALPLLWMALKRADEASLRKEILRLIAALESPQSLRGLLERADDRAVQPLLEKLAARFPVAAMLSALELGSACKPAQTWLLGFAERQPEAWQQAWTLPAQAQVGIAHPLELDAAQRSALQALANDYELSPPFTQLRRDTHALTPEEAALAQLPRLCGRKVATGSLLGLAQRGWVQGAAEDGARVHEYSRSLPGGWLARLVFFDGFVVFAPQEEPTQTLESLDLHGPDGEASWGQLGAVALSELLRDVEGLANGK